MLLERGRTITYAWFGGRLTLEALRDEAYSPLLYSGFSLFIKFMLPVVDKGEVAFMV